MLEGRIFRFAPPNTQVSLNRPFRQFIYAHRDGCFLVIKEINGVSTPFVWSAIHQTLLSRQNVTLPLGDEFHFYLHAFCIEKRASEYRRAKVIVSERNYQQPNFTSSNFAFRVPLDAQKGYKVGTVRAFDTDKVIYNWQLEYDLLKDTKNILAIGDNGDIYLTKDISDVSNDLIINTNDVSHFPYVVLVQACDCGSPRKCSTATVEIAAVTITGTVDRLLSKERELIINFYYLLIEPKDIQILAATEKYLIVCWKHPSYGLANFYQLHMVPSNRITTADLEIRIEADYSKAIQCAVQRETHEIGAGFSLILFAHDGKERTPSRVHNYQIGQSE